MERALDFENVWPSHLFKHSSVCNLQNSLHGIVVHVL